MKQFVLILSFLITLFFSAHGQASGLADLKFGRAQIADSQWNVQACTQTATCQIYSKNPGTVYKIPWYTGQLTWSTGDYVAFTATGNGTNPWNAVQYTSSGTQKAVMGTGHIINMGTDYFFFVGNDNDTGQLFSMTQGFANTSGVTWTGTLNPTVAQTNTYAANGSTTPLAAGQTAPPPATYTTTYSTQTSQKLFGNRTITYSIPVKTVTNNSTGAATTSPVTPAVVPPGYISVVPYTGGGGWQNKTYTYTATTTGSGYLMFAFRHDLNYWVIDNVSVKANNTGANLLVNGGLDKSGMMTVNVGGTQQTVAAPTAWGLAYQTNQSATLGGGFDSGMWYDTSTGSYGAIYQNVNFTAGTTYTITFMVASDYNSNGDTVQMAVYAGSCEGESTACALPASTGMTSAVTPSQTYTVGCTTDCPAPPAPTLCCGGSAAAFSANSVNTAKVLTFVNRTTADSQVHIEQIGTQNIVEVNQSGTRNNYVEYYGNGLSNDINIAQSGNASTQANYVDLRIIGNFNSAGLQQTSTGGTKGIFADVSGNNNSLLVQQKDGGSHYAEITLSGGNKNVDVLQQGSASHMAKVNLSGTPTDLSLTQSGSTQNYYSITHNCTTVGGCAKITVTQGQ